MKGLAIVSLYLGSLGLLSSCLVGELEDGDLVEDNSLEAKATAEIRVISHNVFKQQSAIQRAMNKADAIDAQVVALQEVCPGQKAWLESTYGDRFTIGAVPATRPALQGCPLPDGSQEVPFNVIIWRGGKNGTVKTYFSELGGPALAPGNILACVKFERAKVPVHACSVHLISGDWVDPMTGIKHDGETVREQQMTGLRRIARTWFDGNQNHFGILAGDFNSTPYRAPIDKLYSRSLGGDGDFVEYNNRGGGRDGTKTVDTRKIDYIFFSDNRAVSGGAVDVIDTDSNHHMIVSSVQMRK